jgi:hypothetical protein
MLEVVRQIDRGHAARSELALDAVRGGQRAAQAIRNVGHRQRHFDE